MSIDVFLARHASHDEVGSVLSGRSDIPLSAVGRTEAERLAERLSPSVPAAVHSSPRRRACETAEIVARRHGLAVTIVDALDEIDFGDWAGRSFAELAGDPLWDRWNLARSTVSPPGGETMASAVARALDHVSGTADGTLCVTHCDIIRGVVAHLLGLDPDRLLSFDVDPASLTTVSLHSGGGRVVALNERCR